MKKLLTSILAFLLGVFCHSQTGLLSNRNTDTLKKCLFLKSSMVEKDQFQLCEFFDIDENKKYLKLFKNDTIFSTVILPKADDDVKNFSLEKMQKTIQGFDIYLNWGGGNYLYKRILRYKFYKGDYYLFTVVQYDFVLESDKTKKTKNRIKPRIKFNEVDIISFCNS